MPGTATLGRPSTGTISTGTMSTVTPGVGVQDYSCTPILNTKTKHCLETPWKMRSREALGVSPSTKTTIKLEKRTDEQLNSGP